MSPTEWIRQPKWIKMANIQLFNNCKTCNVPICNPDIFAHNTVGVKFSFHP